MLTINVPDNLAQARKIFVIYQPEQTKNVEFNSGRWMKK